MRHSFVQNIGKLSVLIGKACGPLYFTSIALSIYEVFTRYVLNAPTVWTTEAIMCCVGAAWMLSAPAVTQQNRHITVTVLEMVVGAKIWSRMSRFALVLSMVAVAGLIWATFEPALHAVESMERSGSAFNPPLPTLFKVLIVVASSVYLLQLFARLIERRPTISPEDELMEELSEELFEQQPPAPGKNEKPAGGEPH